MKTIIIGAGPAGLMAGIKAACENNEVIIIEKNEKAGKKLFITGKGRCNVTNDCSEEEFIKHVVSNPKFLYSAIHAFSSKDTIRFFEERKTPLVVERGNRVFPKSYHAYDITDALVKECHRLGVRFYYSTEVSAIRKEEEHFVVETDKDNYLADFVIIATGGLSYPATGSTGDGYRFAKAFNHNLIEAVPALTGLGILEEIPSKLYNFTLKNVALKITAEKKQWKEFGELTFYKNYLDGPIAIKLSSHINRIPKEKIRMELDLKPALDEKTLLDRISREVDKQPHQIIEQFLHAFLPSQFLCFFTELIHLNYDEECTRFTKEDRLRFINGLKHFPLTFKGVNGFERAVVTSGGISVKDISPKTMESKLVPHLYFAGEVIDVDAYTGGFNIQTAFSTGALAGTSVKEACQ